MSFCLKSPAKAVEKFKAFFTSPSRLQQPWTPESVLDSYGDTPDMLIAASVVESFAKDFDKWEKLFVRDIHAYRNLPDLVSERLKNGQYIRRPVSEGVVLMTRKGDKPLKLEFGVSAASHDRDGIGPWVAPVMDDRCKVNGVEIIEPAGGVIHKAWIQISKQVKAAKDAAAKAEAAMKANEAKWNLAETLLNMRRDENGALVPVTPATNDPTSVGYHPYCCNPSDANCVCDCLDCLR